MDIKITALSKRRWKGYILPIGYKTNRIYEVVINGASDGEDGIQSGVIDKGYNVTITPRDTETPVIHTPDEYDYPDRLFDEYHENAFAWGVESDGKLLAAIETCPEEWSNRLRICELWVDESLRSRGVGRRLIEIALEQARLERRRAVILETQSCNYNAIGFYRHMGFKLIGFDSCCYANNDLERGEVRLEFGRLLNKQPRLSRDELIIRPERPGEYHDAECMVRRAFYNKYKRGCDEHFLVRNLRSDGAYLPEYSRIALHDGKIVGAIYYSRSYVKPDDSNDEMTDGYPTITFGPLCVEPEYQGRGVGEYLLRETLELAKSAGESGVIIFGEPDYYPRLGFVTCDKFNITDHEGESSPAFMAYRLNDSFDKVHGRFHEADVFGVTEGFSKTEGFAEYEAGFPYIEKQRFPCQWAEKREE